VSYSGSYLLMMVSNMWWTLCCMSACGLTEHGDPGVQLLSASEYFLNPFTYRRGYKSSFHACNAYVLSYTWQAMVSVSWTLNIREVNSKSHLETPTFCLRFMYGVYMLPSNHALAKQVFLWRLAKSPVASGTTSVNNMVLFQSSTKW
jgi:hypothetical protein